MKRKSAFQDAVATHVNPIGRLGRNMAALTIGLVVGGRGLGWLVRIETRTPPAVAPQWISRMRVGTVADHHEPTFEGRWMADRACRHFARGGFKDLLDENRLVREMTGATITFNRAGRGKNNVHLFRALVVSGDGPAPEIFVSGAVVRRHTQRARGVHHGYIGCGDLKLPLRDKRVGLG